MIYSKKHREIVIDFYVKADELLTDTIIKIDFEKDESIIETLNILAEFSVGIFSQFLTLKSPSIGLNELVNIYCGKIISRKNIMVNDEEWLLNYIKEMRLSNHQEKLN